MSSISNIDEISEQAIVKIARRMIRRHMEVERLRALCRRRFGKSPDSMPTEEILQVLDGLPPHILEAIDVDSIVPFEDDDSNAPVEFE